MKKQYYLFCSLLIAALILSGCKDGTANTAQNTLTTSTEASIPAELHTSQYIRQQWALNLQLMDVARINLVCNDTERPFAAFTKDELYPLVELINSINGQFVAEPTVAGATEDFILSTLYVFMNDDTRYTIQKIAGKECNYISIDNSVFMCDDELFDRFPESGTELLPINYTIVGNPPIEIPNDQISRIQNIAPESDALPVPKGYETYDWMVNLKAEDVAYIEFVNLDENQYPYRLYQGDEIQEVIDLFQTNECYEFASEAQWHGFFSKEFHIIMKDGTAHTVCSIYSTKTVIDGAAYTTISDWLNNKWPEIGNEPLPENWDQIVASRNYHVAEDEVSVLSTSIYEAERRMLDHNYDTDIRMGSISRNYFIGRGAVELSAIEATSTGLIINANWSGSPRNIQLMTKTECWLEQWCDDNNDGSGEYVRLDSNRPISLPEQTIISQEIIQWSVQWDTVFGSLEPGNYRVGMVIYEIVNGIEQNQTICYAKFSIN